MYYISTRKNYHKVSAAEAIKLGMVPKEGLFVPENIPDITGEQLMGMARLSYQQLTQEILRLFLTDYSREEVNECVAQAYRPGVFDSKDIVPLHKLSEHSFIMELWHGPTAAFKDVALQIMPYFLSKAKQKLKIKKDTVILVATSGDTGKAALEGFKDVQGIKIIVFYPYGGVSSVQELQMTTTEGSNTHVVSLKGNFDDCQNAVKEIFSDQEFNQDISDSGYELSSANSINWGRLAPQIVYYFWAYLKLLKTNAIKENEKINFCIPTGNFGNILAGYYACLMGLPIKRLICASNENKVLTDFINTGMYDRKREFIKTNSPSMDILISSNLERFLFEISGRRGEKVKQWFEELQTEGSFQVESSLLEKIQNIMVGYYADQGEILSTIKEVFENHNYLLDTHTAVGVNVYQNYRLKDPETVTVIGSTANPYKFNSSVLEALKGKEALTGKNEFILLEELKRISGQEIHPGLKNLDNKKVNHTISGEVKDIKRIIKAILGI
ncbi:threonine synthase [Candidatus Contubernalis alkaliaceticus]|uniref:threonine synthase n=1 Tax=Candidatus Contubernalis alkaliaceticus TaxID=338645 RepID=UPI001F4C1387|nr:threonine synthase [Candidatus Contubernalis alkalaceticus]UNC92349.1 threonine synthase [Candidatus Contubernalis alkalaceticus]